MHVKLACTIDFVVFYYVFIFTSRCLVDVKIIKRI